MIRIATTSTFHNCSPPPSLPNSQPPTREASPAPMMIGQNARTPPPKRWKRSFDMSHPGVPARKEVPHDQPLSLVSIFRQIVHFDIFIEFVSFRLDCGGLFSTFQC